MSLTQQQAESIVATLKSEFNGKAGFEAKPQLSGTFKIFVHHPRKAAETTLKAIENRVYALAGKRLTRDNLEFKTGQVTF
jgi:hypothetical protein